ncbi:MAG: thermonuclease family protein [Planctomycetota bacterium]
MRIPLLLLFAMVVPAHASETESAASHPTDAAAPAEKPAEKPAAIEAEQDANNAPGSKEPKVLTGKIVGVASGDTLTLLVDATPTVVRIAGVDAPELDQPYGNHAKRILTSRFAGKVAVVTVEKRDADGIAVGGIKVGKQDIGLQMLRAGMAWHYKDEKDTAQLAKSEAAARKAKRGLWRDASAVAPWRWRDKSAQPETAEVAAQPEAAPQPAAAAAITPPSAPVTPTGYWLNTRSNVRHNRRCEYYDNTSQGRYCTAREGKRCGYCGG